MRLILFSSCMDKDMEFFEVAKNGELVSVMDKGAFYLSQTCETCTLYIAVLLFLLLLLDSDVSDAAEVFTERSAAGLRSLNSSLNGSVLLYMTSPKLCMVSLSVVPIVGIGAMSLAKYSRRSAL